MPTIVRSNETIEHLSEPEHSVPTARHPMPSDIPASLGSFEYASAPVIVSQSQLISVSKSPTALQLAIERKRAERQNGEGTNRLVSDLDSPYYVASDGHVAIYRIRSPEKPMSYVVTIDEHEIGPFKIIREIKRDRGWLFLNAAEEMVQIPPGILHRAQYLRACYAFDASREEYFVFVDESAADESVRAMIATKYAMPLSAFRNIQRKPVLTWLVIREINA